MNKLLKYLISTIKFLALYIGLPSFILIFLLMLMASFHFMPKVPHMKGTVLRDGKPIQNITVQYISVNCDDKRNGAVMTQSKTNKDGGFQIIGENELRFTVPLPASWVICWQLCFQEPGKNPKCWEVETCCSPSPPESFELICDLDSRNVCRVVKSSDSFFRNRLDEK
jgi:hypothetical protein